ncbi:serine hydrolase FSH [Crassisporium funariophilum]|nr:serine hydrolase FSH [Crassisporium funariophilum]
MAALRRVLVLHGYSQNATIFSKRLGALRKECKDIDFVFVNAPHILLPSEMFGSPSSFDSVSQTEAPTEETSHTNPELALRAWWKANKERNKSTGLQESIMAIKEVLVGQTFDGVLGFSQGAAFAAIISALLERPHLNPDFLVDGEAPHPPLKFCVAVSGFRLMDPICDPLFSPSYATPTLHVLGKTDVVVVEERSQQLVAVSANARVEEHDGGHFVPSKGSWRKFLNNYMRDPSASHASPSTGPPDSEPSSGTSTPGQAGSYKSALMMKL